MMVQERYVDIGLDHGTSNSAIAAMVHGRPRMIMINGAISMPSVVCVTASGQTSCGSPALKRLIGGHLEGGLAVRNYKRAIGDGAVYRAPSGKPELSAVAAGGKVVGALLHALTEEFPAVAPRAGVISVPAKFDEAQLQGTREAARLAGLEFPTTVQEPVAAGMAFGLQNADDGRWLIFDLGAGTLDVTLLYRKFGRLEVPPDGHDGDSELGGCDLDGMLADYWIGRHDQGQFPSEQLRARMRESVRGKREAALAKFIEEIEAVKIALSEDTVVGRSTDSLRADNGQLFPNEISLTRDEYEKLLPAFVSRAIRVGRRLLDKHGLRSQDIDGIVYIGGPTKTPYIRKRVADELGLRVIAGVDPMTAVAEGAAIYAATLELPDELRVRDWVNGGGPSGRLLIAAEASSLTPSYLMIGRLELGGPIPADATIIVERGDGGWRSDPVPVSANGAFEITVSLIDRGRSVLSQLIVSARGGDGRALAHPETINVWYPPATVQNQMARSLFVGLADGKARKIVAGGTSLPYERESEVEVRTARTLRRGTGERLRIPFYDGVNTSFGEEDAHIRSAVPTGMIEIDGNDTKLTRDLTEGSEVRISADVNPRLEKTCHVYVPDQSVSFTARMDTSTAEAPDLPAWRMLCERLREEIERWRSRIGADADLTSALQTIDDPRAADELRALIKVTESEVSAVAKDARRQVSTRLAEQHGTLRTIARRMARARIRWKLDQMRRAASGVELSQLDQLAEDLQRAQDDALEELENLVDSLNYHVRFRAVINIFEASIVADSLLRVQNIGSHGALLRRIQKAWEGIEKRYETIDRNEIVVLVDLYEASRFAIPGFADMIEAVRRLRPRLAGEAFTVSDVT